MNVNRIAIVLSIGLLALSSISAGAAEFRANPLFSDHMILQRGHPIRVWGVGDDGAQVTVTLGGESAQTTIKDGQWTVDLPPLDSGGPDTLTITGPQTFRYSDVLIGDVWICAGQSNMRHTMGEVSWYPKLAAAYQNPQVRLLKVADTPAPQPVAEIVREKTYAGGWQQAEPAAVGHFSAIGYLWADEMQKVDHVPIGLIDVSMGGSAIQAWLDEATLDKINPAEPRYKPTNARDPVVYYNGTVAPVQKFPIKGILWYQGETNTKDPFSYLKYFTALIRQWRGQWGEGNIPFYWVQLASHGLTLGDKTGESWAWLREAQAQARNEPNTGMAVALDIGEYDYIHPSEKRIAAQRLAAVALHGEGHPVPFEGPRFARAEFAGGKATLHFTTDSKLQIEQVVMNHDKGFDPGADPKAMKSPADALTGFIIAGADQHFVPAEAKITGDDTVVVSSAGVPDPKAVRYGWADFSLANLYNANGFPAEPFRTDDWPPSAALIEQAKSVVAGPGAPKN